MHAKRLMTSDKQVRCGCRIGVDYPVAIADHGQARRGYLELGKYQVAR